MSRGFLAGCEREPLHLSGAILPHGAILVADAEGRVSHVSPNVTEFLGTPATALLGAGVPPTLLALAHTARRRGGAVLSRRASNVKLAGVVFDLIHTAHDDGSQCFEFTPAAPSLGGASGLPLPGNLRDEADLAAMRAQLVEHLADLSGYQRVMFYGFHDDGDGEVLAEARREAAYGSYLGLRFPASDIPRTARALYLNQPWRLIPDANALPLALLATDASPPDLSTAHLRSVAPVHCSYLANMEVRGSLSFPVAIGQRLLALVACHHRAPHTLSVATLDALAQGVQRYAMAIATYQAGVRMRLVDGLQRHFHALNPWLRSMQDLGEAWPALAQWLMVEFEASDAVLCLDDDMLAVGEGFDPVAVAALDDWFCQQPRDVIWLGNSLSRQVPDYPLSGVAGATALRLVTQGGQHLRLYLARQEHIHDVRWGGNPDKPTEVQEGLHDISPRRSFEQWVEQRLGYCRPWDNTVRLRLTGLRQWLLAEAV